MKVTTKHVYSIPGYSKKAGFCRSGFKRWCKRYGFKHTEFLRGVESERLLATGDAFGVAVVNWAKKCEAAK